MFFYTIYVIKFKCNEFIPKMFNYQKPDEISLKYSRFMKLEIIIPIFKQNKFKLHH